MTTDEAVEVVRLEVSKVELGPTDTLVIKTPRHFFRRPEDRRCFIDQLVDGWVNAPRGRIIVLPDEMSLEVLAQPIAQEWK